MASLTYTATLAASTGPIRAIHAGVNSISGSYNAGATVVSDSARVRLCKIPPNCTITSVQWYHTSGATARAVSLGVQDGATDSVTLQAIFTAVTQATSITGGPNLPYLASASDAEKFKYVIATAPTGTVTTSLKMAFTIYYTMDP